MAVAKLKQIPRKGPLGFAAKVSIAIVLGLSFAVVWSTLSPTSTEEEVATKRNSFEGEILEPESKLPPGRKERNKEKDASLERIKSNTTVAVSKPEEEKLKGNGTEVKVNEEREEEDKKEEEGEGENKEEQAEIKEGDAQILEETKDENENPIEEDVNTNPQGDEDDGGETDNNRKSQDKKNKKVGPLFDPSAQYHWKQCGMKSGHNYIPCWDFESDAHQRHHERSCPHTPVMCLVSLPKGYREPLPWPERESKIWYGNVVHPKLSSFAKSHSWLKISGDHLEFPKEQSEFKGGANQYLDFIEEVVPDLEWGKNIRVVLDIGCIGASFSASLLEKSVLVVTLALANDQTDLAQVALERGMPAILGSLGSRRLPFPSGVFDVIHCGDCNIAWHHDGGKLLLEINRILRPGGYFISSTTHGDVETEQGMRKLLASISWLILAHKTNDESEMGVRVYQRPASNDIFTLRRSKNPPFCKEDEKPDIAWYTPINTCLHRVPAAIEERGSDWPAEWPNRLFTYPDWLGDLQGRLHADQDHWKAVVEKSYLNGLGIDWSTIRNVMDMKAVYGGFAAALASQKVWVMNVVPVHAPNTLPIIFERGLFGVYHDWCEPFSTYPRSYDLLHADHLFSRLKNRCKHPIVIVVEMDRILRPGGWAIIRDKVEIVNPLESILKSLNWEIRMTYGKDKEGIIVAQKTTWRP
ncbi:S-adenosyl-L-methionine-dependent methyltransferases superfamily protein [Rhynchospora pubera]|uniref:Methyltransferase n=1 Tax=Rhynchospora pubera TaxID=906938 RepID=A0AAV8H897_9POAL|nr:S-adenosyl-L-methionine-dependent methyltransferases superfamily protein [Rhynchospora pubera]